MNGANVYGPIIPGAYHGFGHSLVPVKVSSPLTEGSSSLIRLAEKKLLPTVTMKFFSDGTNAVDSNGKYSAVFFLPSRTCTNACLFPASFIEIPGINAKAAVSGALTTLKYHPSKYLRVLPQPWYMEGLKRDLIFVSIITRFRVEVQD